MSKSPKNIGIPEEETNFFMSTGDLMAALLMIFVLLLAATLLQLIQEFEAKVEASEIYKVQSEVYKEQSYTYRQLADTYQLLQDQLYEALASEFEEDLPLWSAVIDPETLSIRFQEPDVLFEKGKGEVSERFQAILDDFIPRYVGVLYRQDYRDNIEEIRIEGHTSSEWNEDSEVLEAYFNNMQLSQDRTRNVLRYSIDTLDEVWLQEWVKTRVTANGLSSSKPILVNDEEDSKASRRVEFRVRTNAEEQMAEIIKLSDQYLSENQ